MLDVCNCIVFGPFCPERGNSRVEGFTYDNKNNNNNNDKHKRMNWGGELSSFSCR